MTKYRQTAYFAMVLLVAAIFGGIFTFIYFQSQDYVVEERLMLDKSQIYAAQELLSRYDYSEYEEALRQVQREIRELEEYSNSVFWEESYRVTELTEEQQAELKSKFGYTSEQAASRLTVLNYCEIRLKYALDYAAYALEVAVNVEMMSDIPIFTGKMRKNILKTGRDFYGLENVQVGAGVNVGIKKLLENDIGSMIAVIATVICAVLYTRRFRVGRKQGSISKGRLGSYTLGFVAGIFVLYGVELLVCEQVWTLGDFNRAVQSVDTYMTCPYMMSVGEVVALATFFKLLACGTIFLFCVGVFCCEKKWVAALSTGGCLAAELWMLKRWNVGITAQFHGENLVGRYGNTYLFGEVVSLSAVFVVFAVLLFLGAAVWAVSGVRRMLLATREEMERNYFEEVNQRYTRTRMIRHDMNNHLTAVAMLMDEGRYEEARGYLSQVSAQLEEARPPVQTGIPVLDAVLFSKFSLAREKSIQMEMDFQISFSEKGVAEYDLCSLFGNILDNAVEACEKTGVKERTIRLLVKKQMDMICVFCENPCPTVLKESESLVTWKEDKENHGLGLKQVKHIAGKYHGTVEMGVKDGVFSIAVLFQPNK